MARGKIGTVIFKFLGETRDLDRAVKKTEGEIGGMAKRSSSIFNKSFSKITSSIAGRFGSVGGEAAASLNGLANSGVAAMGSIGTAGAAAAAVAGAAFIGFAKKGIAAFQGLASEIRAMERSTGADAETASRLVATLNALHIETSAGERAFFLLSKTIDTNAKKLTDHGIAIAKNKDGSVDLYGTLLNVRTAYRAAGAGAEGSAIAAAAFGRSAQALLPVLGATAERLNEIDDAAKRHHEFLTQDQIDKAKQLGIATTEVHASVEGLEIELGSALAPAAISGAEGLEEFVHAVDNVGGAISKVGKPFGGFGRFLGGFVKDFPGVGFAMDALRGHFKAAALDAIPLSNTLRNLFGHHKKAAKAAEENAQAEQDFADTIAQNASQALSTYNDLLNDTVGAHLKAETTSSSFGDALANLADDYKGVDESAGGAAEKTYTFQDAMHDQFDSLVDANEAALDYADSLDALDEALHGAAIGSEDAAAAMDRLTRGRKMASDPRAIKRATDAAVKAAEQEVDAEVASGQVADTAAARKEALRKKLVEIQQQYPEVAGAVQQYIDKLDKIPNLTTKAEDSTKKLSKAKKDLSKDILDVIGKAKDEADAMKTTGTALNGAFQKHWALLNVLNYLKAAYPTLSGIIDTFLADVETSWTKFLSSPAAAPAIAGSFAPGSFGLGGSASAPTPTSPNRQRPPQTEATAKENPPFNPYTDPGFQPIHLEQNIYGDGLNSGEVADLALKRAQRALVGSRAG